MKNLTILLISIIIALIVGLFTTFKILQFQITEKNRVSENYESRIKSDSLKYSKEVLDKKELMTYLDFQRQDIKDFVQANGIKPSKVTEIITHTIEYKDTAKVIFDMDKVLQAINKKTSIKALFKKENECMSINGYTEYKNDSLRTVIDSASYHGQSDKIEYTKRDKFLGLRIGKKRTYTIIKDKCGESETTIITSNDKPK